MPEKHIAVIGAGISGLTVAYLLRKRGFSVTLLERSDRAGGTIVTEQQEGYLIDLGPNSTLETSQTLRELVDELGLGPEKVYGNEASNKRYVLRDGVLQPIPMKPMQFLKTRLFSSRAKWRLMKEPFIPRIEAQDISLADYVRYRLGREFLDYAINPFVAGVYAGDPEQLSTPAAFPKLWALEQKYGSFIQGAIKGARERKKRQEVAKDRARLFSFRRGMHEFPARLAEQLATAIRYRCEIQRINARDNGFEIEFVENSQDRREFFDAVVISIPTYEQAPLLNNLDGDFAMALQEVPYPPVAVVFMGFRRQAIDHPLDGFGFLVPEVEKKQILGTIFSSTIFPNRAPEGYVALTTFVGGTRQPQNVELEDADLKKLVLDDLTPLLGVHEEPVFVRMTRWPRAIPQYNLGYGKIQKGFEMLEQRYPGLFFAGNFRRGISVGDSVLCADEVSKKVAEVLQEKGK